MNHRILTERAAFYRKAARFELKENNNWIKASVAAGIFVLIVEIINLISSAFINLSAVQGCQWIYSLLVYGPATVGLASYFMHLVRTKDQSFLNCFEGFESFGRSFVLGLLILLFTSLWTMLFIVPGIVAAYRYSMAPMILRDRPDLSPMDCIRESKRIMNGNKGSLFRLDLSFIGWFILSMIPAVLVEVILTLRTTATEPSYEIQLISTVLGIVCCLWVMAYDRTSRVVFYEELITPDFTNNNQWQYRQYNPGGDNMNYGGNGFNGGSYSENTYGNQDSFSSNENGGNCGNGYSNQDYSGAQGEYYEYRRYEKPENNNDNDNAE